MRRAGALASGPQGSAPARYAPAGRCTGAGKLLAGRALPHCTAHASSVMEHWCPAAVLTPTTRIVLCFFNETTRI